MVISAQVRLIGRRVTFQDVAFEWTHLGAQSVFKFFTWTICFALLNMKLYLYALRFYFVHFPISTSTTFNTSQRSVMSRFLSAKTHFCKLLNRKLQDKSSFLCSYHSCFHLILSGIERQRNQVNYWSCQRHTVYYGMP